MKTPVRRLLCLSVAMLLFMFIATGSGFYNSDSGEKAAEEREYVLSKEVIVDDDNCTFRISKVEEDDFYALKLKVFCENKTDTKLMFSMDEVSVNGYEVDPFFAAEIAAGKKTNDEVTFSKRDFEEIGLTMADKIVFTLTVYDSDDWSADHLVEESFTIYPTGLSEEDIVIPERRTTKTEKTIVDNDDVCFIVLDTDHDDIWGYCLNCYIENKTDKLAMVTWDDVSVDGFMIDPFWATEVPAGTRAYERIRFDDSDLEDNEIDYKEIEEIEFAMRVYDSNDWMADDILDDTFTYNP